MIATLHDSRTALFPGSFDPFTIGHYSIVERALPLFDKIIIAIGVNEQKRNLYTGEQRKDMIERLYADEPRVSVMCYNCLTVDLALRENAGFILRGVRMIADFEYEKNLAEVNRDLAGIETVLLYTLPEYSHISSSIVRELLHYGRDVQSCLPPGMVLPK